MKRPAALNLTLLLARIALVTAGCSASSAPEPSLGPSTPTPIPSTGGSRGTGTGTGTGSGTGTVAGPGTGTGGAGSISTVAASDLPCDVASVLQSRCGDCHGTTPKFGAPMSLTAAADFGKRTKDASTTVGQAVIARINDDAHPMPQAPAARLTSSERATLTTWINAGAKPGTCAVATGSGSGAGSGGTTGSTDTVAMLDPDVTCYDLTAHDPASKKSPYHVPTTPDLYHCFSFAPPWGADKVHMVDWKPLIDNDKVIHHWILYNDAGTVTDGADVDCSGAHPSAQMVTGWAPGGQGSALPKNVGQDVSGKGFTLEIHYNNTSTTAQPDASGVKVCVTKKLRPNEAGIHWLGTEGIALPAGGKATGVCKPTTQVPVTIISSTPHMHLLGRHLTTSITRANGKADMLIDEPFDFASQVSYTTPQVINPGDTLTTTCEYGGAAFYGQGTKQEMCYNFVLAYPNGGLASGSFLRKNGCTGL